MSLPKLIFVFIRNGFSKGKINQRRLKPSEASWFWQKVTTEPLGGNHLVVKRLAKGRNHHFCSVNDLFKNLAFDTFVFR